MALPCARVCTSLYVRRNRCTHGRAGSFSGRPSDRLRTASSFQSGRYGIPKSPLLSQGRVARCRFKRDSASHGDGGLAVRFISSCPGIAGRLSCNRCRFAHTHGGVMSARFRSLAIFLGILILAGGLRFFHLGDWPFALDETATLREHASLFNEVQLAPTDQLAAPAPGNAAQLRRASSQLPVRRARRMGQPSAGCFVGNAERAGMVYLLLRGLLGESAAATRPRCFSPSGRTISFKASKTAFT